MTAVMRELEVVSACAADRVFGGGLVFAAYYTHVLQILDESHRRRCRELDSKQRQYCGDVCGLSEPSGSGRSALGIREHVALRAVELRSAVSAKIAGRAPEGMVKKLVTARQPTVCERWWIPQCRNLRCSYGQTASDVQMTRALSYLRELVDDEDWRMTAPTVEVLATRIARAHLARSGRNLPDMTQIPDEPEATAQTVFCRSWPWHLPEAEHTAKAVLSERFWTPRGRYYFEPNGIPF